MQQLRHQRQNPRRQPRHAGVAGAKLHLQRVGRRVCVLDHWNGLLDLGLDYGAAGKSEEAGEGLRLISVLLCCCFCPFSFFFGGVSANV